MKNKANIKFKNKNHLMHSSSSKWKMIHKFRVFVEFDEKFYLLKSFNDKNCSLIFKRFQQKKWIIVHSLFNDQMLDKIKD
jgi:hypothetical protein